MTASTWKKGSDLQLVSYLRSVQERLELVMATTLTREQARLHTLEKILALHQGHQDGR